MLVTDVVRWSSSEFHFKSFEFGSSSKKRPEDCGPSFTFPIGLGASLDESDGVLGELPDGLDVLADLVHVVCRNGARAWGRIRKSDERRLNFGETKTVKT